MAKGKGSSGFKGAIWSVVFAIFVVGLIGAILRINNIKSFEDAYNYVKRWSDKAAECAPDDFSTKCKAQRGEIGAGKTPTDRIGRSKNGSTGTSSDDTSRTGNNGGTSSTTGSKTGGDNGGSSTTKNGTQEPSNGSKNAQKSPKTTVDYLNILDSLKVAPAADVDYKRSDWKHWVGSPCDTRDLVLINQGKNVKVDKSNGRCKIVSGTWFSPYDEVTVTVPKAIDIDHVIPLAYAARHGGQSWSPAKKQQFANDQSQLLAVTAKENRSKSDKGPEDYTPPKRSYKCSYAKLWVTTASKYGVSITEKDKFKLRDDLQKC